MNSKALPQADYIISQHFAISLSTETCHWNDTDAHVIKELLPAGNEFIPVPWQIEGEMVV